MSFLKSILIFCFVFIFLYFLTVKWPTFSQTPTLPSQCERTITTNVVALDQPLVYNRLGAVNPVGMIYALREDVLNKTTFLSERDGGMLNPGEVILRFDKRPRPLTLRANIGDCLQVNFENLLDSNPQEA